MKTYFVDMYSSKETGGLFNYYTLHIRDPQIQAIVTKKWIDRGVLLYKWSFLLYLGVTIEILHAILT